VKAFEKENEAQITVASGKVGVNLKGTDQQTVFLLAGQQVIIHNDDKEISKRAIEKDIAAWRESRLVFDNESLDNVFHALERKYNVHIHVLTPSLLHEVTSMKLDNQPLSDVLTTLSFSKHFQYQSANDTTVVIR
jgi:transmembrane sensor